ncbi:MULTISPECIES: restriction endonuclease subunit S [unclassified Rhizobium]|uniref:restriction endonuclease subunit S n=1 Tax=unclassified Rhizobium TaxID=2613769 RepID=UPI00160D69C3|nr:MULTISPECIES: restriction endonuclease subunit S [unclassified Rhizobium]MBB3387179.1 type I restriction enzyme S subunit [Rhizobium sp. BK098]MBB3618885.1 type I restriction enzyme S subunit [Rhizobium sp. BK609]MBB3684539.1 type I restriction enzyme S subunit [Rhizobium sp. BK612]
MTSWPVVEFSSLLAEPTRNGVYKSKEFHGRGAKMVNMGELFAYPRLPAVPMKRVELSTSEERRFKLEVGDLLFARRSLVAEGAGKCSIVMEQTEVTAFESSIIRARLNRSMADPLFYFYFFNSTPGVHALDTIRRQVAVAGITGTDLVRLKVPAPTLRFQNKVSSILGSLDDKIELNRRMNGTLEAMAQAIFRDWFVDFGPSRRKLEGAADPITIMGGLVQDPERAQALADLFPGTLGDDGLPAGWEEKQVGDVTVLLKRGLAPSYSDNGILVINQKCIRNKAVNLAAARRHDEAKRPAKDRRLEEYDVVVNSTGVGTLGRVATVRGLKEQATADSHVTICRADTSKLSKLVLSLFMEGQEALIETMGHGSTGQTELSPASLSAMTFTVAPKPVQLAFDNFVVPLRNLVTSNSEHSLTLAETRDLLLPKLMSGEIRLGEAVEVAA